MSRAEPSAARIGPLAPTSATRPTAAMKGGDAGFGRLFGELRDEVEHYIRQGDAGSTAASTLSAEGSVWRARAAGLLAPGGAGPDSPQQQAFLESIAPWAREAADKLGVAPELVSAHAALESGWGQRLLRTGDGAASHNLFGIKTGGNWEGAVSEAATTEYVNGEKLATRERFRAYPDQASAFRDYAQLLIDNPRYRGALGAGSDAAAFAQGLARGGYATDPAYAAKLARLAAQLQGTSE
ncbi:glycoside hydrolase family 73 protein [Massilia niastensis]|uniref:glycoside hydrolase family 73 protein n=1 Tax=Massilia niastensis TaxID=544911 RepID=UPI00035CB72A|nr:glucosaminidase domain-containing protein [Massilia niastensis]